MSIAMAAIAVGCGPDTATPPALRAGRDVYGDTCSVCHGSRGQGGVGPDLSNVLTVWPSCDDQQEWVALGTAGWRAEHGDTYGSADTIITGEMPAHADHLSQRQIAEVVAFERVQYGGGDADSVLRECGLLSD